MNILILMDQIAVDDWHQLMEQIIVANIEVVIITKDVAEQMSVEREGWDNFFQTCWHNGFVHAWPEPSANTSSDRMAKVLTRRPFEHAWKRTLTNDVAQNACHELHVLQGLGITVAIAEIGPRRLAIAKEGERVLDYLHWQINPTLLLAPTKARNLVERAGWLQLTNSQIRVKADACYVENYLLKESVKTLNHIFAYDRIGLKKFI